MLTIHNVTTPSPAQWEIVMHGARNAMNSWDRMDSYTTHIEDEETLETADYQFFMGENDLDLAKRLSAAGSDHRKFLRQLPVHVEVTAPLYWWKEYDTYKVGTVANSCSTMHKIHAKPFERADFSHERLSAVALDCLDKTIEMLEAARQMFVATNMRKYWDDMIQLLPSSYNQMRTCALNYENLMNIYHARRNHKLDEWHTFCDWIETLPYADALIVNIKNDALTAER